MTTCDFTRFCGSVVFWCAGLACAGMGWAAEPVPERGQPLTVSESEGVGFSLKSASVTGIDFTNRLADAAAERNRILENGSGVAAADVDGDGWTDLYFCSGEGSNQLFLNRGGFRFEAQTEAAAACPDQASTGAVFADVDGDGDPDLLVTGVGAGVRLFLNDGTGRFSERVESGLDREAGSMSASLADADQDGDLDLYVANYQTVTWKDFPPGVKPRVTRVNGKPVAAPADRFVANLRPNGTVSVVEIGQPDTLYRNDGAGHFEPVSWTGGQFLDEAGNPLDAPPRHWGLSVAFRDFNGDQRPDLYVCNDFLYGNDDFFLNQGAGVFRRIAPTSIRHSSWSAMAVDLADIDRDRDMDFLVVDMLSQDLTRRLTQRANQETGSLLRAVGAVRDRPQQQHNSLYLNRGDGTYAEVAHLAGLEATEWSWSVLFMDVDLDGWEDVLVGNGHGHDLLDGDVTIDATHAIRSAPRGQATRTLLMYPNLALPDVAFRNRGNLTFEDVSTDWGFNHVGISQGMCRADLDRDGDWDVVVNRLNGAALILENQTARPRIAVRLKGKAPNTAAVGARVRLIPTDEGEWPVQMLDRVEGGRYLSDDGDVLVFAAGSPQRNFRLEVVWPDGAVTVRDGLEPNRRYEVTRASGGSTAVAVPASAPATKSWFRDVSNQLSHEHRDRLFDDRQRQTLLPNLLSQLGPGMIWGDWNQDGWEDLVVPGGAVGGLAWFENQKGRGFRKREAESWKADQHGGLWLNHIGDSFVLAVGESNYEHGRRSTPGVRLLELGGDGAGERAVLPGQLDTVGPMVSFDLEGDGDLDLFVGGRVRPGRYPEPAISRWYRNDGGRFRLDLEASRDFVDVGLVSGATSSDLDGDGDSDLVLAVEWGPVQVWWNEAGRFRSGTEALGLHRYRGWWNGVAVGDFDEDGRMDLVATNWGRNSKYERYRSQPIRLRYGDLDGNGMVDVFEEVFDPSRSRWNGMRDLIVTGTAVPVLQSQVRSYRVFAERGVASFFGARYANLPVLEANWMETTVFLNRGDRFEAVALPIEAQFAPAFGVVVSDFTGDGHEDLFLAQNFFATQPETPRYDAGQGLFLAGTGTGTFEVVSAQESGIRVWGEQRGAAAADFNRDGRTDLAVGQNGSRTHLFENQEAPGGHQLRLRGPEGNRAAIGTRVRRLSANGSEGPLREIVAGSGYWSQNSSVTCWPVSNAGSTLEIQWPDQSRTQVVLEGPAKEWDVAWSPAEP